MTTRMRFRTDNNTIALMKALGQPMIRADWCTPEEWDATEPAQPGDVWRLRWYAQNGEGPIAGYAICCPKCLRVHHWSSAGNCGSRRERELPDGEGTVGGKYTMCDHQVARGSCWDWTGSAEENTLSETPSLLETGTCGWHGYLTNGELRPC